MAVKKEQRRFQMSKAFIKHSLARQNGTIIGSMSELLQNGIDAGAKKIDITVDEQGFVVADDGSGFTREQVDENFRMVGFKHENKTNKFARFGVGRLAIWHFAKTVSETRDLLLEVDVADKGLKYRISDSGQFFSGYKISGRWYEPLSTLDLVQLMSQMRHLVKYPPIPVTMNGRLLNSSRSGWAESTENAYYHLLPKKDRLSVFNNGFFICHLPKKEFGTGGIVNTKKTLLLNLSRNDIIRNECPVWKEIEQELTVLARKNRKMEEARQLKKDWILSQWIAGEISSQYIMNKQLFPTVTNALHPLKRILDAPFIFEEVEGYWQKHSYAVKSGAAFIVTEALEEKLSVTGVNQFVSLLSKCLHRDGIKVPDLKQRVVTSYDKVVDILNRTFEKSQKFTLEAKKLTKRQSIHSKALEYVANGLYYFYMDQLSIVSDASLSFEYARIEQKSPSRNYYEPKWQVSSSGKAAIDTRFLISMARNPRRELMSIAEGIVIACIRAKHSDLDLEKLHNITFESGSVKSKLIESAMDRIALDLQEDGLSQARHADHNQILSRLEY